MISPDQLNLQQQLDDIERRLFEKISSYLKYQRQRLDTSTKSLQHPGLKIKTYQLQFQQLQLRLHALQQHKIEQLHFQLDKAKLRFAAGAPKSYIQTQRTYLTQLRQQLSHLMQAKFSECQSQLGQQSLLLEAVSPLSTLQRGYAIVKNGDQQLVSCIDHVTINEGIEVALSDGQLYCQIHSIEAKSADD